MAQPIPDDKTQPIPIGGKSRRFFGSRDPGELTPDPDAPAGSNRSNSTLIYQTISDAIDTARSGAKPDEAKMQRLQSNLQVLATLADAGMKARSKSAGSGGGNGGMNMIMSAVVALAASFGVLEYRSGADPELVKALSDHLDANDAAIDETDKRVAAAVEETAALRKTMGKMIEWNVNRDYEDCKVLAATANGINWVAGAIEDLPKSSGRKTPRTEYNPIHVICDETPYLPDGMHSLWEEARQSNTP